MDFEEKSGAVQVNGFFLKAAGMGCVSVTPTVGEAEAGK